MSTEKKQFRVDLALELAERVDDYFEEVGIQRTTGIERMLAWFLDLPPTVRADAMGQLPQEIRQDAARCLLDRMAKKPGEAMAEAVLNDARSTRRSRDKTRRTGA